MWQNDHDFLVAVYTSIHCILQLYCGYYTDGTHMKVLDREWNVFNLVVGSSRHVLGSYTMHLCITQSSLFPMSLSGCQCAVHYIQNILLDTARSK